MEMQVRNQQCNLKDNLHYLHHLKKERRNVVVVVEVVVVVVKDSCPDESDLPLSILDQHLEKSICRAVCVEQRGSVVSVSDL
ncbi:hypothetical protein ElyMa_001151900 [Elysia marginata]|uniref:Uncharacterized protein n=1 Tax=Elysia marginata TaxID=1093978 RepID=A0AAV4HZS0_9GAST|nr:hypothetical protein ElyMa_001151900 [Elysia marginata]